MKKTKIQTALLAVLIVTVCIFSASAQDANAILKSVDGIMSAPKDQKSHTKITLKDKNGTESVREADVLQKGTDKRLFKFTAPAAQAGIAFLSLPDDIMYLYMPAFGTEKKIATSVKNQSFAGTDFTYDDLEAKPFADKYTPTLQSTGTDSYVLVLTPKATTTSDYSKIIMTVDKTNYYPTKCEYYNLSGNFAKMALYTFNKVGSYWSPQKIVMGDLTKLHYTTMTLETVEYDTGLTDDDFTIRNLKQ